MTGGGPVGEVRPMIDRESPDAAETRGANAGTRFSATSGLVRVRGVLPIALGWSIVGRQKAPTTAVKH